MAFWESPRWRGLLVRMQLALFLAAVALNYAWEVLQMPWFFVPVRTLEEAAAECLLPAIGDGVMVLALYWLGVAVFRDRRWIWARGPVGYVILLGSGVILGIAVEIQGVHLISRWGYQETMPRLPWLEVGLLPVLQMALLPVAAAALVRRLVLPEMLDSRTMHSAQQGSGWQSPEGHQSRCASGRNPDEGSQKARAPGRTGKASL